MKNVVVTGSNKGIGFEIVKKLAVSKDYNIIIASRSEERGQEAVKLVKKEFLGANVSFELLDISDEESVEAFSKRLQTNYSEIDVLINNAAIAFKGADPTPFAEQARPTMKVNVFGTHDVTQALLPLLSKSEKPRIVFVSSMAGSSAFKNSSEQIRNRFQNNGLTRDECLALAQEYISVAEKEKNAELGWAKSNYGVSKLCVTAYAKALAKEYPNINVTSCCPGWCQTDMSSRSGPNTAEQGSTTPFFLATNETEDIPSGSYWTKEKNVSYL